MPYFNSEKIIYIKGGEKVSTGLTGSSYFNYENGQLSEKQRLTKPKTKIIVKDKELNNVFNFMPQEVARSKDLCVKFNNFTTLKLNGVIILYIPIFQQLNKKISPIKKPIKKIYRLNKKKIKNRIYAFTNLEQTRKKLYFITVTFPFKTSDNQAYKLFNLWLTKLRKKEIIKSYIWVAERQKNKTIHFHMLVNQYFNVKNANLEMRESLTNLYKKSKKIFNGYNPLNYNGIDIAKNRKNKRITNFAKSKKTRTLKKYITKYITKNDTEFNRLTWHCSRDISKLFYYVRDDYTLFKKSDLMRAYDVFYFQGEFFEVFVLPEDFEDDKILKLFEINQIIYDSF